MPDRGKTQGIVHVVVVAYILFLNYFFVVKSVKLLLLGFEMQKKIRGKKKFSCHSKIALYVAVHKKKFKKEYITLGEYPLLVIFLDQLDG